MLTFASVSAKPVDEATARRAASAYLRTVAGVSNVKLTNISATTPFTEFYVFAIDGQGFILIAGDDCVVPVLGYSLTGSFVAENMPAHVRAWFDGYERQIRYWKGMKSDVLQTLPREGSPAMQWKNLKNGLTPVHDLLTAVAPMMTTTWNQAPYYNAMTPYDANVNPYYQNHVVTGCVATATAQIMKYHNHPATGYGSHSYVHDTYGTLSANFGNTTYQWSSMPNALTSTSSTTQVNAVATLMYHIGVADEMNYTVSSSGASNYQVFGSISPSSQNSLVSYFKYRPDMALLSLDDLGENLYSTRLRTEMDQGRPVLISGYDTSAGHSFVIDGYNAAGLFHVNWGWGGSCNGYYAVTALVPAESGIGGNNGSYHMDETALTGIRPNTNWGNGGTITVSTDGTAGCTVYGGGSYVFRDTVSFGVGSVPEGYRFKQWNDGTPMPIREFIGTGGSYSFTAQFEQLQGDTLAYCSNMCIGTFGSTDGTWAMRLPSSALTAGTTLNAVQFYVRQPGNYTVKVYTGTTTPTLAYTGTAVVTETDIWKTYQLTTPLSISGTQNVWIAISHPTAPVPVTYGCGNTDAFLWGTDMDAYAGYSFMIKGIFHAATTPTSGDTLSYCGNAPYVTGINAGGDPFDWGIMIPAAQLVGHNYLKSVMAYVIAGENYVLNVYSGGTTAPGTLLHTQNVQFGEGDTLWQEILLDATVAIPSGQNLWIMLGSTLAAVCNYTGDNNSDWLGLGGQYTHLQSAAPTLVYSWLVKAVTSATAPSLPAPTVYITGPGTVMTGTAATFTAAATAGATVTWTMQGATPAAATGATATATWSTPGTYAVVATATNTNGIGRDTLTVNVISCSTVNTFPYEADFQNGAIVACWNTIDADGDGYAWETTTFPGTFSSASYINDVGALTPDNWLVSPQIQLAAGSNYTLMWDARGVDQSYYAEHFGVYVSTTGTAPANFVALQQYDIASSNWATYTLDLSSYAGQSIYVAFRHWNCTDEYWLSIDYVSITESQEVYVDGDTISYVGDSPIATGGINAGGTPFYWGIMLPSTYLTGRNYLSSILVDVEQADTYTYTIYTSPAANESYPVTAIANGTFTVVDGHQGWQNVAMASTCAIPSGQNLWIVLYSAYAAGVAYSGNPYSDLLSFDGTSWAHLADQLPYSWAIKAVTSATTPTTPAPTVIISGYDQVAVGQSLNFEAVASQTASISWSFQNGTPAAATGTTASSSWTTPGTYRVVATATNANGTGRDTLYVRVVDYTAGDTVSYCLDRPMSNSIGFSSGDPIYWGIKIPAAWLANRSQLDKVLLYIVSPGTYTMRIHQGTLDTVPGTVVYTGSYTFAASDTARYNACALQQPLEINPAQNLWITFTSSNVDYPAAATAFMGDFNSDWYSGNDTAWYHVSEQLPVSWMIKAVFGSPDTPPQNYTVTVNSANPTMGTVTGGGVFAEGTQVQISATANNGYHFTRWNDGNTDNPRSFIVTGNVTYTAYFEADQVQGIGDVEGTVVSLYPNPASEVVTISGLATGTQVSLVDLSGRTVGQYVAQESQLMMDVSTLLPGAYFVRIVANDATAVYKLMIRR